MAGITIKKKDGTILEFRHKERPGGSYAKTIRYEGGFAIVTDEYKNETAIPANDIEEVKVRPGRYG